MSTWMEYVYMQKPLPTSTTGVEVVLSVVDPNNNCYEVARATTDARGMYKAAFIPEVPGLYSVIASFEGSESYWPSYAETAINVNEAPTPPTEPEAPASMTDTYVLGFGIALVIILIVGIFVIVLMLRKR